LSVKEKETGLRSVDAHTVISKVFGAMMMLEESGGGFQGRSRRCYEFDHYVSFIVYFCLFTIYVWYFLQMRNWIEEKS
jgi:hypothetical protein